MASYTTRKEEVKEQMRQEGLSTAFDNSGKDLHQEGFDAIELEGGRKGGTVYLPNERVAMLWRKMFEVQFSDGAWRDRDTNHQLEHFRQYTDAEIVIERGCTPRFESRRTHEKIVDPLTHFEQVEHLLDEMVFLVRMMTGDDDYDRDNLEGDLREFEDMEFDVADIENCSQCNSNIY